MLRWSLNNSDLSPTTHILQFLATSGRAFLFVSTAHAPVRCEHCLARWLGCVHQMLLNHFEIVRWVNLRLLSGRVRDQVLTISNLILLCPDTVSSLLIHFTRRTLSHIDHIQTLSHTTILQSNRLCYSFDWKNFAKVTLKRQWLFLSVLEPNFLFILRCWLSLIDQLRWCLLASNFLLQLDLTFWSIVLNLTWLLLL